MKIDWTIDRKMQYKLLIIIVLCIFDFTLAKEPYLRYLLDQRGTSSLNEARIVDIYQNSDECRYVYFCDQGYIQFFGDFSDDYCSHAIGDSIIINRNRFHVQKSKYYSTTHGQKDDEVLDGDF